MAISYPVTIPDLAVESYSLGLEFSVAETSSVFTFSQQVQDWGGEIWKGKLTFDKTLQREDRGKIQAFISSLRGKLGTFYMKPPEQKNAGLLGVGGGTPLVNGASQTGNSLNIDGCPTNTTAWLKCGDFFSIDNTLYQILEDVNTNGSGQATLTFEPNLRTSPNNNATIETTNAQGLFRLDSNTIQWSTDYTYKNNTLSISFKEVLTV